MHPNPTPPAGGGLYVIWLSDTHYYGGRTKNFRVRWNQHLKGLHRGDHCNPHMQAVFDQHGRFEPRVLESLEEEQAAAAEQAWLDEHFGKPGCVNLSNQADRPCMTSEVRKQISEALRGRKLPDEHKENIRRGKVGVAQTNAHRLANSKSHEGLTHSAPTREKMSSSRKGKSIHPETRAKISRAHQGKKMSEASRQKMSEHQKGKPKTPFSEGHKEALAVAMRKSWERRKGKPNDPAVLGSSG